MQIGHKGRKKKNQDVQWNIIEDKMKLTDGRSKMPKPRKTARQCSPHMKNTMKGQQ